MAHKDEMDQAKQKQRTWMLQVLAQAQVRGYYGKLVLIMEDGMLRRVIKEESLKPPTD